MIARTKTLVEFLATTSYEDVKKYSINFLYERIIMNNCNSFPIFSCSNNFNPCYAFPYVAKPTTYNAKIYITDTNNFKTTKSFPVSITFSNGGNEKTYQASAVMLSSTQAYAAVPDIPLTQGAVYGVTVEYNTKLSDGTLVSSPTDNVNSNVILVVSGTTQTTGSFNGVMTPPASGASFGLSTSVTVLPPSGDTNYFISFRDTPAFFGKTSFDLSIILGITNYGTEAYIVNTGPNAFLSATNSGSLYTILTPGNYNLTISFATSNTNGPCKSTDNITVELMFLDGSGTQIGFIYDSMSYVPGIPSLFQLKNKTISIQAS